MGWTVSKPLPAINYIANSIFTIALQPQSSIVRGALLESVPDTPTTPLGEKPRTMLLRPWKALVSIAGSLKVQNRTDEAHSQRSPWVHRLAAGRR
jgi:hypothetical protein